MRKLGEWAASWGGSRAPGGLRLPALIVAGYLLLWLALDAATENVSGQLAVSLLYAPAGLSFALMLVRGVRYAPAVALTMLVHDLLFRGGAGYPLWLLIALPVAQTAVWAAPAVLLVRWIKVDPRLTRMRDVLYFVGVGCLAFSLVAAVVGVGGYVLGGNIPRSEFLLNVLGAWAGEATGVGVATTLVLIASRPYPSLWSAYSRRLAREGRPPPEPLEGFGFPKWREIPELSGQAVLLAATMLVAYGTERGVRLDLAYLIFLPLIWVAIRGDLARTIVCVLVINVGAVLLAGGTVNNANPVLIQFGLMTLTLVGLLLGGLVTERRETSARLLREASHDRLTGLPNRGPFADALSRRLSEGVSDGSGRRSGEGFAVLAVDLDRFADVNNALGYRAGDALLVAVAGRLRAFANASGNPGTARAARIGGDAFAVLVEGAGSEGRAGRAAGRLLEELARPYDIGGREVHATASAGAVVVDGASERFEAAEGYEETEDLLRDADTALRESKRRGPSGHAVFDRAMGEAARGRLALGADLRRATERGGEGFVLRYQPIFSLKSRRVVAAEALVRWEHPERGLLLPARFVPLAEQGGLVVPLGGWVLREACRRAKEWQERAPSEPPVAVCVNISARQLEQPDFPEGLRSVLEETGLDPRALVLEITEGVVVGGADAVRAALGRAREDGVRVAVDDFGTGYSSLSYLSRLPVDVVKIDRSLVGRLPGEVPGQDGAGEGAARRGPADEKLVSGIVGLAHGQGLTVVGEGVEGEGQLEALRRAGCDHAQGYLLGMPLEAGETASLITKGG